MTECPNDHFALDRSLFDSYLPTVISEIKLLDQPLFILTKLENFIDRASDISTANAFMHEFVAWVHLLKQRVSQSDLSQSPGQGPIYPLAQHLCLVLFTLGNGFWSQGTFALRNLGYVVFRTVNNLISEHVGAITQQLSTHIASLVTPSRFLLNWKRFVATLVKYTKDLYDERDRQTQEMFDLDVHMEVDRDLLKSSVTATTLAQLQQSLHFRNALFVCYVLHELLRPIAPDFPWVVGKFNRAVKENGLRELATFFSSCSRQHVFINPDWSPAVTRSGTVRTVGSLPCKYKNNLTSQLSLFHTPFFLTIDQRLAALEETHEANSRLAAKAYALRSENFADIFREARHPLRAASSSAAEGVPAFSLTVKEADICCAEPEHAAFTTPVKRPELAETIACAAQTTVGRTPIAILPVRKANVSQQKEEGKPSEVPFPGDHSRMRMTRCLKRTRSPESQACMDDQFSSETEPAAASSSSSYSSSRVSAPSRSHKDDDMSDDSDVEVYEEEVYCTDNSPSRASQASSTPNSTDSGSSSNSSRCLRRVRQRLRAAAELPHSPTDDSKISSDDVPMLRAQEPSDNALSEEEDDSSEYMPGSDAEMIADEEDEDGETTEEMRKVIVIQRANIVECMFNSISQSDSAENKLPLKVSFENELEAVDMFGVSSEAFRCFFKSLFGGMEDEHPLFRYDCHGNGYWPRRVCSTNSLCKDGLARFWNQLGIIVGMGLLNNHWQVLSAGFSPVLFVKLLKEEPITMSELTAWDVDTSKMIELLQRCQCNGCTAVVLVKEEDATPCLLADLEFSVDEFVTEFDVSDFQKGEYSNICPSVKQEADDLSIRGLLDAVRRSRRIVNCDIAIQAASPAVKAVTKQNLRVFHVSYMLQRSGFPWYRDEAGVSRKNPFVNIAWLQLLQGIRTLNDRREWNIFRSEELSLRFNRSEMLRCLTIDHLQAVTHYDGFDHPGDPNGKGERSQLLCQPAALRIHLRQHPHVHSKFHQYIGWFWSMLQAWSKESLEKLLLFVSSNPDLVRKIASREAVFTVQLLPSRHTTVGAAPRYPTASSCFNTLKLPQYATRDQLEKKLLFAIEHNEEFDLE